MKTTRTTESTVSFDVSARLVAILGQHLIRDNTVGLMELIKNGYDADADEVTVEMYDLNQVDRTTIVVQDNGDGMTREVLTGPWLTVAHGHKESSKDRAERSRRGRLPLGEKGVGRFAAHKLGRRLLLITRPRGQETELVLDINWDDFEASRDSLQSVELRLTERPPRLFRAPDAHGTRLEMSGAREKWQRKDVEKLQASLIRLTNPRFGVADFRVTLRCPEYPDLENLAGHDITERYQFRLDCQVDAEGIASYEYRYRDDRLEVHTLSDTTDLWQERLERPPACGPVSIQLCAWLARQKTLEALGTSRDQIRILAGVSIYRDGFRILPYGDEGDDWLGLDARRINNPTVRFGNRQIIGAVAIDQVHNRALIDKTNREGLQENQAYQDLRKIVLGVVNLLEQLSLDERQQQTRHLVQESTRLVESASRLEKTVRSITSAKARLETAHGEQQPGRKPDEASAGEASGAEQGQVVLDIETVQELEAIARDVRESADRFMEIQEEERDAFLHLIGSGLAAERFVHETDRQLARAVEACATLRSVHLSPEAALAARQLDVFVNSLRGELRFLGQLRYVRRSQRARRVSVREITELVLLGHDPEITRLNVRVDPWLQDDFTVFMSEAALAQVIDNVMHNALYWLGTAEPDGGRRLRVDLDASERTLVIWNNGPTVDPVVRDRLFHRPFVTTKEDGHGLGMYLCAEIMRRAGGSIGLLPVEDGEPWGAGFVLRFPPETSETLEETASSGDGVPGGSAGRLRIQETDTGKSATNGDRAGDELERRRFFFDGEEYIESSVSQPVRDQLVVLRDVTTDDDTRREPDQLCAIMNVMNNTIWLVNLHSENAVSITHEMFAERAIWDTDENDEPTDNKKPICLLIPVQRVRDQRKRHGSRRTSIA